MRDCSTVSFASAKCSFVGAAIAASVTADPRAARKRVDKASIAAYRLAIDPFCEVKEPATVDADQLQKMRPLIDPYPSCLVRNILAGRIKHDGPAQVRADLDRLQKQLHELHQRAQTSTDQSDEAKSDGGHNAGMVMRGR